MDVSVKHHYLPEFYLKGFTNRDGTFAIYDKIKNRIKKRLFYPSTHFFDHHRNSVILNGQITDFPEKGYALIDSKTSKIFQKIQDCEGVPTLSPYEMQGLQFFVSDIFWRNPDNDRHFKNPSLYTAFIKEFFKTRDPITGESISAQIPKEIFEDESFIMNAFRPLAGPISFEQSHDAFDKWQIGYNPAENFICSDNPLILKNPDIMDIFHSDFVFPLSKNHMLIHSDQLKKPIKNVGEGLVAIQLALFFQSKKYCAGSTKTILELLMSVPRNENGVNFLKNQIFGSFLNPA
jgi:hypothetical protein